ncbi:hypothetical protein DBR43_20105 [Pedobacter sp. KBW06]|uniref:hypothetical protein n=1 Tax=Pedobacter sp. KBW06 TaxID=2153359 RepID=UPI000F5910E7|nr:hypothetical protein [Pedobacter sp. KBW06]RQO70327.1 hypothetical protein DBR43_20105 [Pedobacter sp. KBW06]
MKKINKTKIIIYACICMSIIAACKKKDYYFDGGLASQSEAEKAMNMYDYLKSHQARNFDSLMKIIDMTGTKNLINQPGITFFPPCNESVVLFQNQYKPNPSDLKQLNRPLSKMNLDTLRLLLNRLIIPNSRIDIEKAYADGKKYYKDNNGDSLFISGVRENYDNGGVTAIGQGRFKIVYEHRKTKMDTVNYESNIKTHNLITANGIMHVLNYNSSFHSGLKIKK